MSGLPYYREWPRLRSCVACDPALELRVGVILRQLTIEEKVGQVVQAELAQLTPDDVTRFHLGSALNGAGVWPNGDRHASVDDWVKTTDAFWAANEEGFRDRPFRVPFMWATDAVHGNNNVHGATIFPHNVGLGAANDPDLIRRIGAVTAREVAAIGVDWTFAPTVATPRDRRWGRYYEGYCEVPEIVHAYAAAMVAGLQGDDLTRDDHVIATVKHWVGDGATVNGVDRGVARCPEDILRNVHAMGFYSGISAGAQSVMASFSSWEDPAASTDGTSASGSHKIHGSHYLLTEVLKTRLGFDGIVISDWDAHGEVAGCTIGDATNVFNAGIDVLMISGRDAWQSVIANLIEAVASGRVTMERLDEAVRRVLRVKMRAGLWEKPRPQQRPLAGRSDVVGCAEHRALAREAVRKSLVLLKNTPGVLPLRRSSRVLVTGSGADSLSKQAGGWTLSWQGDDVTPDDLPGATTIGAAVRSVVGPENCTVDPLLGRTTDAEVAGFDAVIAVLGEDSYAEMCGTIRPWRSLGYADLKLSYAKDTEILRRLRQLSVPVVTVFLGGRPLYLAEEINLSDAFVVAWLPGTEGAGVTDVLFADERGEIHHDFVGRLPVSFPRTRRSYAANRVPAHIPDYRVPIGEQAAVGEHEPLFPVGYGLRMEDEYSAGKLPLDSYVDTTPVAPVPDELPILTEAAAHSITAKVGGHHTWSRVVVSRHNPTETLIVNATPLGGDANADGLMLDFQGYSAFTCFQFADEQPRDLRGYAPGSYVEFDVQVHEAPTSALFLACHDDYPAQPGLDLAPRLQQLGTQWSALRIPIQDLADAGMDLRNVDVPFMLYTDGRARLAIRNVRWRIGE